MHRVGQLQHSTVPPQALGTALPVDGWTAADASELDVLTHELAGSYAEHRKRCEACDPEPCPVLTAYRAHREGCWNCANGVTYETATYGPPCRIRLDFLAHGDACKRCNPCPYLKSAIAVVIDWRESRALLSRAESLRLEQTALNTTAPRRKYG